MVPGPEYLLINHLPNWRGSAAELMPGMSIRRLNKAEQSALQSPETMAHLHPATLNAAADYWLAYNFDNPHAVSNVRHRRRQEAAFKLIRQALYAIEILHPADAANALLLFQSGAGGMKFQCAEHGQPFLGSEWSRRCPVARNFAAQLPDLLKRVQEVFRLPQLRLQIPVWLFEQGLGAPDPHIRILLWATGLDSLTRASGQNVFRDRLCDLLGGQTSIFPADTEGRRPAYSVDQVAGHLYELRNEMAHGLPFHEMFRKRRGFLDAAGEPVAPEFARYRYDWVLQECALFLLSKTLCEVLLRNLEFDIHLMEWRGQD